MKHEHLLTIVVAGCVAAVTAAVIVAVLYVRQADSALRDEQIATCERGNLIRHEVNTVVDRLNLGLPPLKMADCSSIR